MDLLIIGLGIAAAVGGYRLGFVARATSWIGMAIGLFLAARFLPTIVEALQGADRVRLLFTAIAVLVGGAFVGQAIGLVVGAHLHLRLPTLGAREADRLGGAVAGVLGVIASVWLLLPAAAEVPGWPSVQTRNSAVVRAVDSWFPPPPDTLQTLRQLIGENNFPRVFDAIRPAPRLDPPPAATGLSGALADQVARSTVKVESQACGRVQDGSGAVVGPDLVATNAHVVAGGRSTAITRHPDGSRLRAQVVAFDPNRDLAILRVSNLNRPALAVGDAGVGTVGAVFGHPGGGPLVVEPFQVGERITATGTDIYDRNRTERQVLVLSSALEPGDSGAGLIDSGGVVVGVAFAIAPDRPAVAYALATSELQAVLATVQPAPIGTGPCLP